MAPSRRIQFAIAFVLVAGSYATVDPTNQATPAQVSADKRITWLSKFETSDNYGQFIRDALSAALANDSDAQYFISKATYFCRVATPLFKGGRRPQDIFENDDSFSADMRK